jgi:hypothetical protein
MKHLKSSLLAFAVALLIISGSAYASFPTKKQTATEQTTANNNEAAGTVGAQFSKETVKSLSKNAPAEKPSAIDEMWILVILWFFLGFAAAHRWYAKKPIGWNILYIITLGGCGVWAIVDLVNILTDNF